MEVPVAESKLTNIEREEAEAQQRVEALAAEARSWVTSDMHVVEGNMETASAEVQDICATTKLNVKDRGEHFIGRTKEIKRLIDQTTRTVKAKKARNDQLTGSIVCGATGVGKTTLLEEARDRMRKEGITVLQLQPTHLHDPKSFSDAVQSATGNNLRALLSKGATAATETTAHAIDGATAVYIAAQLTTAGVPTEPSDVNVHALAQTHEAWQDRRTANVNDVLRTLGYLHPNGVAIWIDEAQGLIGAIDHEDPRASTAAKIITALATANGRNGAGVKNATIIFSGLGDTAQVIGDLGSFGLDEIQLQPMEPEQCSDLMVRELRTGAGKDAELAHALEQAWIPPMLEIYGEWTRHAAAGAQALRTVAAKMGRKAITSGLGWAATITMANSIRDQVYQDIRDRAQKHDVPDELRDTLAQALLRNDRRLSRKAATTVSLIVHRDQFKEFRLDAGSPQEQLDRAGQTLRACLRAGILEYGRNKNEPCYEHYYCPVPSLLSNLTEAPQTHMAQMMAWLSEANLSTDAPPDNPLG